MTRPDQGRTKKQSGLNYMYLFMILNALKKPWLVQKVKKLREESQTQLCTILIMNRTIRYSNFHHFLIFQSGKYRSKKILPDASMPSALGVAFLGIETPHPVHCSGVSRNFWRGDIITISFRSHLRRSQNFVKS